MKLTKFQQQTLQLINNQYEQLERFSKIKGVDLYKLETLSGFGIPNFAFEQEEHLRIKSKSRQEVFEKSKKANSLKQNSYQQK